MVVIVTGCRDGNLTIPSEPPVACFEAELIPGECAIAYDVVYSAACSSDDVTATDRLVVRWDFNVDGSWDTDFGVISEPVTRPHQRTYNSQFFFVAAEVRDDGGNSTTTTQTVRYPNSFVVPDLIAWSIRALTGEYRSAPTDTVTAGEPFWVLGEETCWRDSNADWGFHSLLVTLNGEVIKEEERNICPGTHTSPCHPAVYFQHSIPTPGTYVLRLALESPELIQESTLTNNEVSSTLVVVPR